MKTLATDRETFAKVVHSDHPSLGIDLEFTPTGRITLVCAAEARSEDDYTASSLPWEDARSLVAEAMTRGKILTGHALASVDVPRILANLGLPPIAKERIFDTYLWHYLTNADFCLRGDTQVVLGDGSKERIESLVKRDYRGLVRSVDSGGRVVTRHVTGSWRNPRNGRKFFCVKGPRKGSAVVTGDHAFLTLRGWVPADQLKPADRVASGKDAPVGVSRSFLIGSLLGDSCVTRNSLQLMNTEAQEQWLDYKTAWIGLPFRKSSQGLMQKRTTRVLDFLPEEPLDELDLPALAAWFFDDGSRHKVKGYANISVTSWSDERGQKAAEIIRRLGYNCKWSRSPSGGARIYFSPKDFRQLAQGVLRLFATPDVAYKLPPEIQPNLMEPKTVLGTSYVPVTVTEVPPRNNNGYEGDQTVYCLSVEGTQNFVTNGGVVHNCKTKEKKDGTESRGTGHLDLWTMASIYTDLNQWKACRGSGSCAGPCPQHDPVGYNAMDGVGPDLAKPRIQQDSQNKGIPDSLYRHLVELTEVTELMQGRGCKVDVPYVRALNEKLEQQKQALFLREERPKLGKKGQPLKSVEVFYTSDGSPAPFNPNASAAVKGYFKQHGILLAKSDKDSLQKALRRAEKDTAQDTEVVRWLQTLLEYKQEGKGLDTWFGPEHVDAFGFIHPRFNPCGTSTRRLASSSPNFQNIPKHGAWAKDVRRALIPRSKDYDFARADSKQLELRMVLYLAGLREDYGDDAFAWLVKRAWDLFEEAVTIVPDVRYKNPVLHESGVPKGHRELAKRVSHAGDYLEGFKVFYPLDLQRERTVSAVREGALVLYQDWEYAGGVVGFTGTNLATSLFGDASWGNRKKALGLQEAYFERFPEIRQWHRSITEQAERGYVTTVSGHYLALRGTPEENAKEAAACHGQGEGAGYVQKGMIALHRAGFTPTINIHDENVVEVPVGMGDNEVKDLMQLMAQEFPDLGGFKCPVDVERGPNYVDTRKL